MEAVPRSRSRRWVDRRDVIPLTLLVVVWVGAVVLAPSQSRRGDVLRFNEIAHGGTPYIDQQIEYPPLETALIVIVGASSVAVTAVIVAIVNAAATICCWRLLRARWSPEVGWLFLWFALPLQVFMPFRIDTVSVLLAVAGIAFARRGREREGGGLLGAAVLFKLWPIVLVPLFLVRRFRRAFIATATVVAAGIILWVGVFGIEAVRQVVDYRGATGWQIESVFGAVARLVTGAPVRIEAGASRIGHASSVELLGLRLATLTSVAVAWLLARRRSVDPAGGPALASVACVLLLSPVASPQYIVWLLPWAAITSSERRSHDVAIVMLGAGIAASAVFAIYWGDPYQVTALVVLAIARAVCVGVLAVIGFTHRSVDRNPTNQRVGEVVPSV
jgi:hypothetical protein